MAECIQYGTKLTRRSLLSGALTIGGGAGISAIASTGNEPAFSAPAARLCSELHPAVASASRNIAETDSGKVFGYSRDGVIGYRGIPYGATTAGAARFQPARKPLPWAGIRAAICFGWVCPSDHTSTIGGRRRDLDDEAYMWQANDGSPDEDCLRLNVWTPATDAGKRPVLFWIHGGGFVNGSSSELPIYDGENLARRGDVVVVSINHRLGPLGFWNLTEYGDQYAHSANVGMLDLVAALEWVKVNIGNFGGDPNRVLIFGQSGGGDKVSALLGMPAAKGLFHRAAIQSCGTAIRQLSQDVSLQTTAAMLKELGIDRANIARLHQIPNEDILDAAFRLHKVALRSGNPIAGVGGWGPIVDGHDLPRDAWEPTAPEASTDVPLVLGSVLNEMANSVQMGDPTLENMKMDEVRMRLEGWFPGKVDALVDAVSQAHTIRKPFDIFSISVGLQRRVDILTMARLKVAQGKAPVFVYKFVWQTPVMDGRARAPHSIELPFVFYNSERCSTLTGGGPSAAALAGRVSDAWTSFARNGNPSHAGLPRWAEYSEDDKATMVFDVHCELRTHLDDGQVEAAKGGVKANLYQSREQTLTPLDVCFPPY
jgi:para-nitrobenzyl esterase